MAEKLRQIAQRLKDKVHLPNFTARDKVDQIITRYVPATRVTEIAEKLKNETVSKRVRDIVNRYEKFTGVEEIMALQNTVVDAQERFMAAQERRRELGRQVTDIEMKLKELHSEMQNTMKGDDKYLHLCTEEHKFIVQERALRALFGDAEREERELFATMSAAVKLGHERERAHAERNKYWYIVASIFGTVLGIAGSSINNHLKMSEFRQMMEQQMARSASVLYTIAGGGTANRADITEAMKAEFAYQESSQMAEQVRTISGGALVTFYDNLAKNLELMQENINNLVDKQESLIDVNAEHDDIDMESKIEHGAESFDDYAENDDIDEESKIEHGPESFDVYAEIDDVDEKSKIEHGDKSFDVYAENDDVDVESKIEHGDEFFDAYAEIDDVDEETKIEHGEETFEHLQHRERTVDTQLRDLTRAIISASQSSLKSDAEITKALSAVHQDLEEGDQVKESEKNKVLLEPNQILTGIGVIMAMAIIFGNFIGRVS